MSYNTYENIVKSSNAELNYSFANNLIEFNHIKDRNVSHDIVENSLYVRDMCAARSLTYCWIQSFFVYASKRTLEEPNGNASKALPKISIHDTSVVER